MKKILLTSTVLFLIFNFSFCQKNTINIWPDDVPNSKETTDYNYIEDTTGSWSFIRHIQKPKLDAYLVEGKEQTAAVIICPGGAYWGLAFLHEGEDVAKWFNSLGISAFVLRYRLPDTTIMQNKTIGPLQDAQEAMRTVRRNAEKWNIDPHKIGIMGFSAGGHLASTLSTHYNDSVYAVNDTISARPNFSLLIYPVISMQSEITHMGSRNNLLGENPDKSLVKKYSNELQVDSLTPPAFLVHSMDDNAVPVENSIRYGLALKDSSVPCEMHIYPTGGHGYGMGKGKNTEATWTKACEKWMKATILK